MSPNTSRILYSRRPLRSQRSPESAEIGTRTSKAFEDRMNIYNEPELSDGIYNQQNPIKSSSSSAASPLKHSHHSLAVERRSKRYAPGRSPREPIRDNVKATTTQLLNMPYSTTSEQYATDSITSSPRNTQRTPRKAAENAKILLSRLPQKESARDWTKYTALREKFEIERENEEVLWFNPEDEL